MLYGDILFYGPYDSAGPVSSSGTGTSGILETYSDICVEKEKGEVTIMHLLVLFLLGSLL